MRVDSINYFGPSEPLLIGMLAAKIGHDATDELLRGVAPGDRVEVLLAALRPMASDDPTQEFMRRAARRRNSAAAENIGCVRSGWLVVTVIKSPPGGARRTDRSSVTTIDQPRI